MRPYHEIIRPSTFLLYVPSRILPGQTLRRQRGVRGGLERQPEVHLQTLLRRAFGGSVRLGWDHLLLTVSPSKGLVYAETVRSLRSSLRALR